MLVALVQNGTTQDAIHFAHKGFQAELPMVIAAEQHGYSIGHRTPSGQLQLQAVGFNYMGASGHLRHLKFIRLSNSPHSPLVGFIVMDPNLDVFDPRAGACVWCVLLRLPPQAEANYMVVLTTLPSTLPPGRALPREDFFSSL